MIHLLLFALLSMSTAHHPAPLHVMTFNIRYDNPSDKPNDWAHRREDMVKMLADSKLELFGLQECLDHQVKYIDSLLPDHKFCGVGRDDGKTKGEYSPIFYNTHRLKLKQWKSLWLSPTPDKPSKGWDAVCIRIATCAQFKDKTTGKVFWAINTHFDHVGQKAREESAKMLVAFSKDIAKGQPLILMGDFNSNPENIAYQTILHSGFMDSRLDNKGERKADDYSFNGFKTDSRPGSEIDFIFHSKEWSVSKASIRKELRQQNPPLFYSDHYAVEATLSL